MSQAMSMINDTLKAFAGSAMSDKPETKIYCKWIHCIKGGCAEGYNGMCNLPNVKSDYPQDGLCYDPHFEEYDKEMDELGAYEKKGIKNG